MTRRSAIILRAVRGLASGAKSTPLAGVPTQQAKKPLAPSAGAVAKKATTTISPPQPLAAATESSPYRNHEYYGFSLYSFVDLGAKKQALRNPQPSPKK